MDSRYQRYLISIFYYQSKSNFCFPFQEIDINRNGFMKRVWALSLIIILFGLYYDVRNWAVNVCDCVNVEGFMGHLRESTDWGLKACRRFRHKNDVSYLFWQLFVLVMLSVFVSEPFFISPPLNTITVTTRTSILSITEEEKKAIRYRLPSYQLHLMKFLCVITNKTFVISWRLLTHAPSYLFHRRAICRENKECEYFHVHLKLNDGKELKSESLEQP